MSRDEPQVCRNVFFGSPRRPANRLRDLLEAKIDAVPAGGEIAWATYYFRDEGLARALVAARGRGVKVTVAVEGRPRQRTANQRVVRFLQARGALGEGCRPVVYRLPSGPGFRVPRLHEKIYYFSSPAPHALIGSFNPSGSEVPEPELIKKIGDQDRGYNFLAEIVHPRLVEALHERVIDSHGLDVPELWAWRRRRATPVNVGNSQLYFFPSAESSPLEKALADLIPGAAVRIATSHFNDPGFLRLIARLARNNVSVSIIAHDTTRRVPTSVEAALGGHSMISFRRYQHPQGFPMHNKFILVDEGSRRRAFFGSLNLSQRSLRGNREVLLVTQQADVYARFDECWQEMSREWLRASSEESGSRGGT